MIVLDIARFIEESKNKCDKVESKLLLFRRLFEQKKMIKLSSKTRSFAIWY